MKFGPVPVMAAEGCVLAHSLTAGGRAFRKGMTLGADEVAALAAAGIDAVTVARLGPDDVDENHAAQALAQALVPDPAAAHLRLTAPFTGRVNLYATCPGIVEVDAASVSAANRVDPMLGISTTANFARIAAGGMVATVKIISYGVARALLAEAAGSAAGSLRVRPAIYRGVSLIVTRTAASRGRGGRDKGARAVIGRVEALGMDLVQTLEVAHQTDALASALQEARGEMVLILTGSATSDIEDVAPASLIRAGGRVTRFGMPVDPGNLLMLGRLEGKPVIGLPGCARSPVLNGADWVLERVACGVDLSSDDIAAMGVGGLLKEIKTRPQPREG